VTKIRNAFGEFIAHRGLFSEYLPENSLGAFVAAVEEGLPIELDVHLTKDDEIVVFHDDTLSRMTGYNRKISELRSGELKTYKLQRTNFTIPTLKDVFETVDNKVPLLIEVKNRSIANIGKLEDALVKQLDEFRNKYAIQSFNPYVLKYLRRKHPTILRGQISGDLDGEGLLGPIIRTLLKYLAFDPVAKPDFISYEYQPLRDEMLIRNIINLRTLRIPLYVWGIHNQKDMIECRDKLRPDGIIFDNKDEIRNSS